MFDCPVGYPYHRLMSTSVPPQPILISSYLELRKAIGVLGLTFPFILGLGAKLIFDTGIQHSVSAYYHTGMGDWFVGTLFCIGAFLYCYKGYDKWDNLAAKLGGLFAVGVALFPTKGAGEVSPTALVISNIHAVCALLFFGVLIFFCLVLFPKSDRGVSLPPRKKARNRVYRACGVIMALCLALSLVYYLLPEGAAARLEPLNPVFWLESLAIFAFGVSWLTKGGALLKDLVQPEGM